MVLTRGGDLIPGTRERFTEEVSELTETLTQDAPQNGDDVTMQPAAATGVATMAPAPAHVHAPAMNPELMREISVEASAEEVDNAFRQIIKRYQRLARIPGFRAGKVPESLVRRKFEREVRQEVLEGLVSQRFREELEHQKVNPVSEPQLRDLQLSEGQPLRFKAQFEVRPDFELTGFDTVEVKRPETQLSDAEYAAELSRVLDSVATIQAVDEDREIQDGDWAEIQFKGSFQNTSQEGKAEADEPETIDGEEVLLEVGGITTLPAFSDALRGTRPGQELSFEVEYPKDFGEPRLAGQTVSYDVTVKAIKRKSYPEKDADLAKKLGSYESFEEFETKLREMAERRKKDALESRAKDDMLEAMIARFPFPVPEVFVQQQIDARLERGLRALAQQGMSEEQMRQLDFHRLRDAQRDQAISEVKASMILDKLSQMEGIDVSQEDLDRELLMLSLQTREPLETLRDRLTRDGSIDRIRDQIRRERTGTSVYEKLAS